MGLMTGDVTINENAACIVMTTEILRSMIYRCVNSRLINALHAGLSLAGCLARVLHESCWFQQVQPCQCRRFQTVCMSPACFCALSRRCQQGAGKHAPLACHICLS